jgi:hypothetical protein
VQYVRDTVGQTLGGEDVRRSGLRIFTTLDLKMQEAAEQIVVEQVAVLRPQYDLSNAALVALKPGTAEILVMVGSADFADPEIAGQVNVAVRPRQPGSAIKPVLYATALDDNLLSAATILWDVETRYRLGNTEDYQPRNYDNRYHGPVSVREALANSYNIPAVKVLGALGVERMLAAARAMGLVSLDRDRTWYGLSLTLGGGEVTLLDLTTAYHTLANGGRFLAPRGVLFMRDAAGSADVPLGARVGVPVVSAAAAYVVTDILSDNQAREPAFGANNALVLTRPAAAKTGTTSDWRDNWTMGYTRFLVAGVWAGNSDGRPMRNVSGVTGAAPIWHAFMQRVLDDPVLLAELGAPVGEGSEADDTAGWAFVAPSGVERVKYGCVAGIRCGGEEWFTAGWLEQTKASGLSAVGESMGSGVLRSVYVDVGRGRQPLGACTDSSGGGEGRLLLRYPLGLGNNLPWRTAAATDDEIARQIRQEQSEALHWSESQQRPLILGPCAAIETIASGLFTTTVNSIAVEEFTDLVVYSGEGSDQSGGGGGVLAALPPPAPPSTSYEALGVAHDNNCGGVFVMGSVSNSSGTLLPGIIVVYQDGVGNRVVSATGSEAQGYGSFKFPILVDAAQDIFITLVDANGAAVSPTATVPYKQGGATDLGCHYVIWHGLN